MASQCPWCLAIQQCRFWVCTQGNKSRAWKGICPPVLTAALSTVAKVKAAPCPSLEEWDHRLPRRWAYAAKSQNTGWRMSVGQEVGPEGEKTKGKDGGVVPRSTITPTPFRGAGCLLLRRVASWPMALAASSPVGRVHAFLWVRWTSASAGCSRPTSSSTHSRGMEAWGPHPKD